MDTNCRRGPGQVYDYLGGLATGETSEVVARDPSGQFWFIQNPDGPGFCWIWGQYASVAGDTSHLPVYTPEPTPTVIKPQPGFTFAFKDVDQCVDSRYIEYTIHNTGALTWESFKLVTNDLTASLTNTWSDKVFADAGGCGAPPPDGSIPPGGTATVGSVPFIHHNPSGESFHADLMLCTQDDLTGQCVTQSINFSVP